MFIAMENDEEQHKKKDRQPVHTMQRLIQFPMAESEELIEMERNLKSAKRIIGHMESQVNDLLEYTKIRKGQKRLKKQPFSKEELRKQMEFMLQPLCEDKNLSYQLELSRLEDVTFMTDKGMLVQIFWQLLDNAAKYTDEGGFISFEAYTLEKRPKEIINCFCIKDNGIGMSRQFQKYVFQPFMREQNRMSDVEEGTGLGLYIAHQLVKLMNGTIQVESQEDKGTTFTITLTNPICNMVHEGKEKNLGDITLLRNKRMILCEENPKLEALTRKKLEQVGVIVEVAKDGYEVIELVRQSQAYTYDAILINVRMSGMNGLEITSRIRGLDREDAYLMPIIALIVGTYDENIAKPIEAGMDAQIAEPIEMQDLLRVLVKYWKKM